MVVFDDAVYTLNVMGATENQRHQLWFFIFVLRAFIVAVMLVSMTLPRLWF